MAVSGDLYAANFSTFQSDKQPQPVTKASAATVAVTSKLTFLTGTVALVTLTPPTSGYCEVTLCFTDAAPGAFSVAGNLKTAYQPIQNRPIDLCFDPPSNKWWAKAVV